MESWSPYSQPGESTPVYTVEELTEEIKDLLAGEFQQIAVEGEVSGYKASPAGHLYFCLKDEKAVLNCCLWKTTRARMTVLLRDGMKVRANGRIDVYPPRGSYQMIVDQVKEVGEGALQKRFEALKQKLLEEGLFEAERKRPLPTAPARIAVVTSPSGAAIQDFLRVVREGYAGLHVQIYPVLVQGAGSADQIARALDRLSALKAHDVVVVTRGGGSLEDLWSFNEEVVARAISRCSIPVISAVGHEVDYSIADFVADVRAATPTNAAQILVEQRLNNINDIRKMQTSLISRMRQVVGEQRLRIEAESQALLRASPIRTIELLRQRIDDGVSRITERVERRIQDRRRDLQDRRARILNLLGRRVQRSRQEIEVVSGRLSALSPTLTFQRGFSVCSLESTGELVVSPEQVRPGDGLSIRVRDGKIPARASGT